MIALLSAVSGAAQDHPVFSVDVHLIRILAAVKDDYGRPVADLKPGEFQVFDNGVPQKISIFEPRTGQPLSIAILIDTSGSTAKDLPYEKESVRRFLNAVIRQGNPEDAAAIYAFNYDVYRVIDFTRNLRSLEAALRGVKAEGGTSMYDALILSAPSLAEREGRHAIVLITDGGDTTSYNRFQQAVEAVHRADAVVYPIVIIPITNDAGRNIGGENALYTMAQDTGGRVFAPAGSGSLDEVFDEILTELRTQYLIGYYPRGIPPTTERFHRIQVRVSRPGLHVSSRAGYYEGSNRPPSSR